jgi:flagellar basal body-associated protein FliL
MEGGVGIILLLIILVVVIGVVALYVTGGAVLSGSKKDKTAPRERAAPEERSDVYTGRDG